MVWLGLVTSMHAENRTCECHFTSAPCSGVVSVGCLLPPPMQLRQQVVQHDGSSSSTDRTLFLAPRASRRTCPNAWFEGFSPAATRPSASRAWPAAPSKRSAAPPTSALAPSTARPPGCVPSRSSLASAVVAPALLAAARPSSAVVGQQRHRIAANRRSSDSRR